MTAVILTPSEIDRMTQTINASIAKHFEELKGCVVEKPMCVKEAADYLHVTPKTLHQWLRDKKIPTSLQHRINNSVYFLPSELHRYIQAS